jgi:hypothetical protein
MFVFHLKDYQQRREAKGLWKPKIGGCYAATLPSRMAPPIWYLKGSNLASSFLRTSLSQGIRETIVYIDFSHATAKVSSSSLGRADYATLRLPPGDVKSHRLRQLSLCIGGLLSSPSSKTSRSQPSSPSRLTSTHFSLCRSESWNFLCEPCMFMLGLHSRVRIRGGTTSSSKL